MISTNTVNTDWVQANCDAIWGSALNAFNNGTSWHYENAENATINKVAQNYAAEAPLRDHSGLGNAAGLLVGLARNLDGRAVIQSINISGLIAQIQMPIGLMEANAEACCAAREAQPTNGLQI